MRKSIKYSQNFIRKESLVRKILNKSSIGKGDLVLEIGAGTGMITQELLEKAGLVWAFEIDKNLSKKLLKKFQNKENLSLKNTDFLDTNLPEKPYKVFSNIPFSITSDIIKKLTSSKNSPIDAYLIIQYEAARKFLGKPFDKTNSLVSVLIKPWFALKIIHNFYPYDFSPIPKVKIVLLHIKKKKVPDIKGSDKKIYQDFVSFTFNQFKPNVFDGLSPLFDKKTLIKIFAEFSIPRYLKPSELEYDIWPKLFEYFSKLDKYKKQQVKGFYNQLKTRELTTQKIRRTRIDKNWRKKR